MASEQMLAVILTGAGGPEVLDIRSFPRPSPEAFEVLIRVRATALNRADILQRRGHYPAPPGVPADVPGLEFAGEVESVGSAVRLWKPGQRVMGLVAGGAYAEYLVAHERTIAEVPSELNWEQAASVPEAFMTAHDALWIQAGLRPNERVIVHAVGSGVGLAALQLARALNAVACGTSRTADKLEKAKAFGLDTGFVVAAIPTETDGKQWARHGEFDVIVDLVGGAYVNASLHALAHRGRVMLVGTMGGSKSDLDLRLMLSKRVRVTGTVLRARPLEEKIAVTRAFAREVVPLFVRGILRTTIDKTFSFRDVRRAHEYMESNANFGKIVLRMD